MKIDHERHQISLENQVGAQGSSTLASAFGQGAAKRLTVAFDVRLNGIDARYEVRDHDSLVLATNSLAEAVAAYNAR